MASKLVDKVDMSLDDIIKLNRKTNLKKKKVVGVNTGGKQFRGRVGNKKVVQGAQKKVGVSPLNRSKVGSAQNKQAGQQTAFVRKQPRQQQRFQRPQRGIQNQARKFVKKSILQQRKQQQAFSRNNLVNRQRGIQTQQSRPRINRNFIPQRAAQGQGQIRGRGIGRRGRGRGRGGVIRRENFSYGYMRSDTLPTPEAAQRRRQWTNTSIEALPTSMTISVVNTSSSDPSVEVMLPRQKNTRPVQPQQTQQKPVYQYQLYLERKKRLEQERQEEELRRQQEEEQQQKQLLKLQRQQRQLQAQQVRHFQQQKQQIGSRRGRGGRSRGIMQPVMDRKKYRFDSSDFAQATGQKLSDRFAKVQTYRGRGGRNKGAGRQVFL